MKKIELKRPTEEEVVYLSELSEDDGENIKEGILEEGSLEGLDGRTEIDIRLKNRVTVELTVGPWEEKNTMTVRTEEFKSFCEYVVKVTEKVQEIMRLGGAKL